MIGRLQMPVFQRQATCRRRATASDDLVKSPTGVEVKLWFNPAPLCGAGNLYITEFSKISFTSFFKSSSHLIFLYF